MKYLSRSHVSHPQAGLSLLELSIVFVVLGLLYGGVMKGYELIETARLQSTLEAVNAYRNATHLFRTQFSALPGDYAKGSTFGAKCKNGNDNGRVDGDGLDENSEAYQFWLHLSASGCGPSLTAPPEAKIGGVFTIEDSAEKRPGLWIVLGQRKEQKGHGALLTPQQAFWCDQKLGDTGNPHTGLVRAEKGEGASEECVKGDHYNLEHKEPACVVYFKIQ